jgi:hypothetical protein
MEAKTLEEPSTVPVPAPLPADSQSASPQLRSAAILRLMEEVRCKDTSIPSTSAGYNRQHNRHNR